MNSESLVPLLLAYEEDLPRDIAALPDNGAAAVEQALLRAMRTALEGIAAPAPPSETVAAVLAAARLASADSDLAALRATLSGHDDGSVEGSLLRTTLEAVEHVGRAAPPADVIAGVIAAAGEAARSSDLAAMRAALGGETVDDDLSAESALLRTTMQALDTLPRATPPAAVVAALIEAAGVAARASELAPVRSAVGVAAADDASGEAAMLRTTWQALERMPRKAPPVSAVHAVLSAAHAAVPAPLREAAALRRAADRPAVARFPISYRRFAYMTAAFAFVGLVGVGLWASGDGPRDSTRTLGSLDEQPAQEADASPRALAEVEPGSPSSFADDAAPAGAGDLLASELDRTVANGPAPRTDAFRADDRPSFTRPTSPPPPPPPADAQEREGFTRDGRAAAARPEPVVAGVGLAAATDRTASPGAGLAGAPAVAPTWEAGSDVRLLSMRLQAIQEGASGLAWEEPPSPLGAAETGAAAPAGFNAVGARSAPARFQVRVGPPGSD